MSQYLGFLALAAVVALAPGPDLLLTLRATALGGRRHGLLTAAGVCAASAVQGLLAASGLGALVVHAEPVFQVIRWAGVAYLVFLGVQALRAAFHPSALAAQMPDRQSAGAARAWAQGFLCNITNPKVLVFNLAVLPQFVGPGAGFTELAAYALTLTTVGAVVLLGVIAAAGAARGMWERRRARRVIEGGTGVVLLGFAGVLATEG